MSYINYWYNNTMKSLKLFLYLFFLVFMQNSAKYWKKTASKKACKKESKSFFKKRWKGVYMGVNNIKI